MATRKILTDAGIRAAIAKAQKTGKAVWKSDGAIPRSYGGLQLYAHPKGAPRWYWRYSKPDGTTPRLALGAHTYTKGDGRATFTLPQAREKVAALAALYMDPASRDVRAHLEREAARAAADGEAAERAQQAAEAETAKAGQYTLAGLLAAYVGHLTTQGKSSWRDARNMFANHVTAAHPALAAMPAKAVTSKDIVAMLRPLTEAGKGRTAAKMRAYMRAAFALAARAELDSAVPAAFLRFDVEANPVQPTAALAQFNKTRERTLSEPELRAYWAAVKAAPDAPGRDAQIIGLLLGGQRPAQLLRATVADVDLHANTLRLHDAKGRRAQPRVHTLPIPAAALPAIQRCLDRAAKQKSAWLFSLHGKAALATETLTDYCSGISAALVAQPKAVRIVREPFQLRDIRRTAETAMARMGISKDVRAQIQSHGLGGVQARHYDRHDYMPEKTAALAAWAKFLETAPADNVAHIGERRTRRGARR
jgi:integrase